MNDHAVTFSRRALPMALLAALLCTASLAWTANSKPKSPLVHLLPPENITSTTRAELRARMSRHGNVMSSLVKAVVLLDRPIISTMATRIADEELLAQAESPGLDRWRPLLPKSFFVESDALRASARELAQAATQGESEEVLARRFGVLTSTCVRCHGAYLHELPAGHAER